MNLINKSTTVNIICDKNLRPKIGLATLNQVSCLLLEHGIVVCDRNQLFVTETFRIRNVRQIGIPSFTELSNNERFVELKQVSARFQERNRHDLHYSL